MCLLPFFAALLCCCQQEDKVSRGEVEVLVDTFPGQSIDFFGALRARVYDDKVRCWISLSYQPSCGSL
jgi:hypothetical protein